ncbi:MAG: molybdopterin molybdotransferase MoeA, partial [Verrucomicrobiales bacterium]|nr:molybdopterin molybdotransferase MoeA [Verrucomicrobiales bacterium]
RLLSAGDCITPGRIGLLASQGVTSLNVHAAPRVAVLSTGDELQALGADLQPGQIYNSNGPMLQAQLQKLGVRNVTLIHCGDTLEATVSTLNTLAETNDVIILSGGVSVGDHDFIKPALAQIGMPPEIWRVRMKPGKPFLYAHRDAPRPLQVFGLPGNPVSAYVTFTLLVRPALLRLMGANASALRPRCIPVRLREALDARGDRPHYFRGYIDEGGTFTSHGLQRSDALFALSKANALVCIQPDHPLAAGDLAQAILLDL